MGTRRFPLAPARPEGARSPSGSVLRSAWLVTALVAVCGLIGVVVRLGEDERDRVTVVALGSEAARRAATDGSADPTATSDPSAAAPGPAPAPVTQPAEAGPTGPDAGVADSSELSEGDATDAPAPAAPPPGAVASAPAATGATAPTAPTGPAPSLPSPGAGVPAASCADARGDETTEQMGDLDLLETSIVRDGNGLRISFRLAGSPAAAPTDRQPTVGDAGGPATTSWGVWMARGGEVLYGVTVVRDGDTWTTSLVSLVSLAEDRLYSRPAPTEPQITVDVPAADVPSLPESFDWWAWSDSTRRPPAGPFLGDDCPNGASETAGASPDLARFPS